ncbi:MAG: hypothetical protein RQ763_00645, partial [Sulfurimonas sp.]|uniref:hypothetical protein n=1 Tax=Sulfurimonas sp. TaxID=2022749 RepID=UPI0028CE8996
MRTFATLFLLLFLSSAEAFTIVNPYDKEIKEESLASVVVEADFAAVDSLVISNDANETVTLEVNPKRSH